jgi:hypothetical protein
MSVDITINETIDVVDITVNPNIIEVNVTRTSGGGGSQTLAQTLDLGNQTGGTNIKINDADAIELENGSLFKKGSYDYFAGGGISRICSVGYEDMWQYGIRYVYDSNGFIRNATNCFTQVPGPDKDVNQRFKFGSLWTLDDGTTYVCTDPTAGNAIWELYTNNLVPYTGANAEVNLGDNNFRAKTLVTQTNGDNKSMTLKSTNLNSEFTAEWQDKNYEGIADITDIPTNTSDLTNDGADGVNPFITALDIPTTGQASTLVREVKNMTGSTLTKGTVVFISGANGNKALVSKALATTDALSARTFGLLQSDILNNGLGNCVIIGDLSGLNTSSFAEGAQLYLSGVTAGTYTSTRTLAPTHLVYIGKVTRSHPTQGQIEVQIQNGYELEEIHDCQIISPANNQALIYESSTDLWKNKTIDKTFVGLGNVDNTSDVNKPVSTAQATSIALKQNASTLIFDSIQKAIMRDNYFWFTPSLITAGAGGYNFATSERISGNSFAYLNNGTLVRGMQSFNTTAIAGTLAHSRRNDSLILTGLEVVFTRKIQFNSNVSGQRFFCGISKGNQFASPTNVEPNTLTDIVGVCQLSTSTNMHVVHNDASGTATTIDLGSSYPCNDSQYNYYITVEQTTTTYIVSVERVTIATGASISTTNTLSSNIPNYATGVIQLIAWISNNASAAIASYLDGGAIGNVKNQ